MKTSLISIKAVRSLTGVKITIQSKALESFWRQASSGEVTASSIAGGTERLTAYRLTEGSKAAADAIISKLGGNTIYYGSLEGGLKVSGYPNISVLRLKGIETGITVEFKGMFLNADIERWAEAARSFTETAYKSFAKETTYSIETFIVKAGVASAPVPELVTAGPAEQI